MKKELILLSDGFRNVLTEINNKYKCEIAEDLLQADLLIDAYCCLFNDPFLPTEFSEDAPNKYQKIIAKYVNDEFRMLSIRKDPFEISYLPKGKTPIYNYSGNWDRKNRQSSKPARVIQKLLTKKYSCKDFENFNNWLKAEINNPGEFTIVAGSDIPKYYNEKYYYKTCGTLGNSCMRYDYCEPFFDIYQDNAKMLILLKSGKILGRAIIWCLPEYTLMDRIYVAEDYLEQNFISYAKEHNWCYRESQAVLRNDDIQKWLIPKDNYKIPHALSLTITLSKEYEMFPYLDSFRYYNKLKNTISTNPHNGNIHLDDTEGEYSESDDVQCTRCGSYSEPLTNYVWSTYEQAYFCKNCCKYCTGIDDYVNIDTPTAILKDTNEIFPIEYLKSNPTFIEINGVWQYK